MGLYIYMFIHICVYVLSDDMNVRKQKGEQIARTVQIQNKGLDKWLVPSQSGNGAYTVNRAGQDFKCSCPDFQLRGQICKHIYAVEVKVLKWFDRMGNSGTEITIKKTYAQDWPNYTASQTNEGRLFKDLLKDLVENVPEPIREGAGRPRVPLKEAVFCAVDKVYSMQSSRRAYSRYVEAKNTGQITKAPNYNVINILLNSDQITPILNNLLHITAMPLRSVETQFSPDSTGFRTTKFNEYCKEKHHTKKEHHWIKCHAITGNKTNIIASVRITENSSDCREFIPLVQDTVDMGFKPQAISADKAYLSKANLDFADSVGATPYILFKSNSNSKARGSVVWKRMFYYFQLHQDEFLQNYHNEATWRARSWLSSPSSAIA